MHFSLQVHNMAKGVTLADPEGKAIELLCFAFLKVQVTYPAENSIVPGSLMLHIWTSREA